MSATNPVDEYEALLYVVDRVERRFPDVSEETVMELVVDEFTRLDRARLRAYVPVLVEGSVLRRLRDEHPRTLRLAS